jgi:hypothetical protein
VIPIEPGKCPMRNPMRHNIYPVVRWLAGNLVHDVTMHSLVVHALIGITCLALYKGTIRTTHK